MAKKNNKNKYPDHEPYDEEESVEEIEESEFGTRSYSEQDQEDYQDYDENEDQGYYPGSDSDLGEYYNGYDDLIVGNNDNNAVEQGYIPRKAPFDRADENSTEDLTMYSDESSQQEDYPYPSGAEETSYSPQRNASLYKREHREESNWPVFLIGKGNQLFFSIVSLIVSLGTGLGIILPFYYLFVLDKSHKKDTASKVINWVAFALPLMVVFFFFALLVLGVAFGAAN